MLLFNYHNYEYTCNCYIISGDKSDLNDTPVPVTPHDEKEEDMEAGHPNSGNEDEGHTSESIKRVYVCMY